MDAREAVKTTMRRAGLDDAVDWLQANWPNRTQFRERRDNRNAVVAMAARLRADSNCVDVGAHAGAFLRHIVRLAPAGRHVAFEPLPPFQERLRRDFPQVDLHPCALSDAPGEAEFVYVPSAPGFSGLRERDYPGNPTRERLRVELARLDDLLERERPVDLIKIDVEGAELQVLRGAQETLARHRPMILLEHGEAASAYGTAPGDVHDVLAGAGLRVFDLDGDGPFSRAEFEARVAAGRHWNWLAG